MESRLENSGSLLSSFRFLYSLNMNTANLLYLFIYFIMRNRIRGT